VACPLGAPRVRGGAPRVGCRRPRDGRTCVNTQKIHFVTLGCPKNQVDTEVMIGMLVEQGHELVLDPALADVLVVNTCSFIEASKVESIDTILDLARYKAHGAKRLIVTGCLPQRYVTQLRDQLPEVDVLIGTGNLSAIGEAVHASSEDGSPVVYVGAGHTLAELERPRVVLGSFFSAYLKVSEGCNRRCSFCIIPKIRGHQDSRSVAQLVAEAESLAGQGVVELNLVAQDLTAYGRREGTSLAALLRALVRVPGIEWIRLLYAYPQHLTDELLDLIAHEPKVCSYIDLPLQHINDRILRAMRRERSGTSLRTLIERLRQRVPGVVLRTSFIVGFPGETDAEFAELLDFVEETAMDHVGVFQYSQEEDTAAARLPGQLLASVKECRYHALMQCQARVAAARNAARVGRTEDVLVCEVDPDGGAIGRTRWQAPDIDGTVVLEAVAAVPGEIIRARMVAAETYDLHGVMVGKEMHEIVDSAESSH
jgi:ribosomal protein S12 methylthiotransferase